MKIGLCGNIANNNYNLAKNLRRKGCDVYLILDSLDDGFSMSQPIWEDADFQLQTDLVMNPQPFQKNFRENKILEKIKKETQWSSPSWVIERKVSARNKADLQLSLLLRFPYFLLKEFKTLIKIFKIFRRNLFLLPYGIAFFYLHLPTIREMRKYDFLVTSFRAPIYAYLANRPYIVYPCGAEVIELPLLKEKKWDKMTAIFQKKAFAQMKLFFTHSPELLEAIEKLGYKGYFFPHPIVDLDKCRPQNIKVVDLLDSESEKEIIEASRNKFIFFVPSRQNFYWKGSDKLLRAYGRLVKEKRGQVFMILAGWGGDIEKSKKIIKELGIEEDVYLLPYALSKPGLIKFYNAADGICDILADVSSYGTSALEALACAKPVITFINTEKFKFYASDFSPPPVLNACTEEEIFNQMKKLVENRKLCTEIGQQSRKWVVENYGEESIKKFIKIIENVYQESSSSSYLENN